jgi:hypothetical protein
MLTGYLLPDGVRRGAEDVAARDVVVVEHLALDEDVGVPSGEVLVLLVLDSHLVGLLVLLLLGGGGGLGGRGSLGGRGGGRGLELDKVDDLDGLGGGGKRLEVLVDLSALEEDSRRRRGEVEGKLVRRRGERGVKDNEEGGGNGGGESERGDCKLAIVVVVLSTRAPIVNRRGASQDIKWKNRLDNRVDRVHETLTIVLGSSRGDDLLDKVLVGETQLLKLEVRADEARRGLRVLLGNDEDGGRLSSLGRLGLEEELRLAANV